MPSPGKITRLRVPQGNGVRDDGGVYEGAEVSIHYDPMISKLAVFGKTRAEAIDRLRRALQEYEVGGIKTTLPFFREIVEDEVFISGNLDTGFISGFNERRKAKKADEETSDLAIIAAAIANIEKQKSASIETKSESPISRWAMAGRTAAHRNRI